MSEIVVHVDEIKPVRRAVMTRIAGHFKKMTGNEIEIQIDLRGDNISSYLTEIIPARILGIRIPITEFASRNVLISVEERLVNGLHKSIHVKTDYPLSGAIMDEIRRFAEKVKVSDGIWIKESL